MIQVQRTGFFMLHVKKITDELREKKNGTYFYKIIIIIVD